MLCAACKSFAGVVSYAFVFHSGGAAPSAVERVWLVLFCIMSSEFTVSGRDAWACWVSTCSKWLAVFELERPPLHLGSQPCEWLALVLLRIAGSRRVCCGWLAAALDVKLLRASQVV